MDERIDKVNSESIQPIDAAADDSIQPFDDHPTESIIEALRNSGGDAWDKIPDPDEFIRKLRE